VEKEDVINSKGSIAHEYQLVEKVEYFGTVNLLKHTRDTERYSHFL